MYNTRELEINRCKKAMHESTMAKLAKVYTEITIGSHLSELLDYSAQLFTELDYENLKIMYSLNLDFTEGVQGLATRLQYFVANDGSIWLENATNMIANVRV